MELTGATAAPWLIVIGAGPAGLSAAIGAADLGLRVTLLDESSAPGGRLLWNPHDRAADAGAPVAAANLKAALLGEIARLNVELLSNAVVWSVAPDLTIGYERCGVSHLSRPDAIIIAVGAIDRALPFPGGSLPGVFPASAYLRLVHHYGVSPGRSVAILGDDPIAADVVEAVRDAGARVTVKVSTAEGRSARAEGSRGLTWVTIGDQRHAVDIIVTAAGFQPDLQLLATAECALMPAPGGVGFVPAVDGHLQTSVPGVLTVGDVSGRASLAQLLVDGHFAGVSAAVYTGVVSGSKLQHLSPPIGAGVADAPDFDRPMYRQPWQLRLTRGESDVC